jgi:hypothetical protein
VGSGNLHNKIVGAAVAPAPRGFTVHADKSLHASGVKASMRASRACHPPWWPVVRRPCSRAPLLRGRAPRAFSSVGESARLITVRSLVRIQKGPRPSPHLDGTVAPLICMGA